jgi:hypothetical protein
VFSLTNRRMLISAACGFLVLFQFGDRAMQLRYSQPQLRFFVEEVLPTSKSEFIESVSNHVGQTQ